MFFVGKLLTMVMQPTALMIECAFFGLLLSRWRIGRALLVVGIVALFACEVLPVDAWVIRPLEDRFPPVTRMPDKVDGIIVLGGSIDDLTSKDRGTPQLTWAANRLMMFIELARRYPEAKLVFTGGSGSIEQGVSNEAEYARIFLQEMGLPPERVVFETTSRTTWENAVNTSALVAPQPGQTWILLTSANHMPRAVGVFRKAGWDVLPWPAGYLSRDRLAGYVQSTGGKLATLDIGTHEWVGLIWYYVRGWTGTLFPGPG